MLAEYGQQADVGLLRIQPFADLAREVVEALAVRLDMDLMDRLAHSTVTLLARFLGWSTSQPRRTAM